MLLPAHGQSATSRTGAKTYAARGVVQKIAPDLSAATVRHQTIPGYMMAMTMDFAVKDTNLLTGISVGDEITFTLAVNDDESWIEDIHRIGHSAETAASSPAMKMAGSMPAELAPGDLLPDYTLVTEEGKPMHFSDFRGRAVAFTFFFTRCPLPDYCPRMNRNFAETRELLQADLLAPTNWQFLSISFDPAFDTPEVLAGYAGLYRGTNADRWLFAAAPTNVLAEAAPRLDLMIVQQGGTLSHNLRTVVLDPRGRIFRQLDGNTWTPEELAGALKQAAAGLNPPIHQ